MTTAALWAWLAALPWKTVGGAFAFAFWERWMGRTTSTPAGSTIDLLVHLWQYRKWGPAVPTPVPATIGTGGPPPTKVEDTPIMTSKNPNARSVSVDVDGPTADLMSVLNEVVTKLSGGAKPAEVAQQEIGQLFGLMQKLGDIPADAKADPETVETAIALGLVNLGKTLRAHLGVASVPK